MFLEFQPILGQAALSSPVDSDPAAAPNTFQPLRFLNPPVTVLTI